MFFVLNDAVMFRIQQPCVVVNNTDVYSNSNREIYIIYIYIYISEKMTVQYGGHGLLLYLLLLILWFIAYWN